MNDGGKKGTFIKEKFIRIIKKLKLTSVYVGFIIFLTSAYFLTALMMDYHYSYNTIEKLYLIQIQIYTFLALHLVLFAVILVKLIKILRHNKKTPILGYLFTQLLSLSSIACGILCITVLFILYPIDELITIVVISIFSFLLIGLVIQKASNHFYQSFQCLLFLVSHLFSQLW